jgi:hypothetical protein
VRVERVLEWKEAVEEEEQRRAAARACRDADAGEVGVEWGDVVGVTSGSERSSGWSTQARTR